MEYHDGDSEKEIYIYFFFLKNYDISFLSRKLNTNRGHA